MSLFSLRTNKNVAPKQRPDRFRCVANYNDSTPTFEHGWTSPKHTVIEGSEKYKEWYRFLRVHKRSQRFTNSNIYGIFFIYELHVCNSKVRK